MSVMLEVTKDRHPVDSPEDKLQYILTSLGSGESRTELAKKFARRELTLPRGLTPVHWERTLS